MSNEWAWPILCGLVAVGFFLCEMELFGKKMKFVQVGNVF